MTGAEIAQRALAELGTPFRLRGRISGVALDCVGLVAVALRESDAPDRYTLKGNYSNIINSYMVQKRLNSVAVNTAADGDIAQVSCYANQQHLMIRANDGWVHAHAGLGRVVHMPGASPWPITTVWRRSGD
jgi:murein DD-endopeptidase / murein LD-carboxypeptidase